MGQGLCACVPSKQWYTRGGVHHRLGFYKNKFSPNSGHHSRFFKHVVFRSVDSCVDFTGSLIVIL